MVTLLFACYKNPSTVIELEKRGCCQYGLLAVYGHPKRGLNGNDYSSTLLCAGIEANTDACCSNSCTHLCTVALKIESSLTFFLGYVFSQSCYNELSCELPREVSYFAVVHNCNWSAKNGPPILTY